MKLLSRLSTAMLIMLGYTDFLAADPIETRIKNECGSNPVLSYIREFKSDIIDPQILIQAKQCADASADGKFFKLKLGDAKIQGCLEREYKHNPEYIQRIAPLIDDAQENTQGVMEGYNQCVNNMYKCGSRFCRKEKKEAAALDDTQLNEKYNEIKGLSNEYTLLRKQYIEFETENAIKLSNNLPLGEFDNKTYTTHLAGKLSSMGGQMQGMLLLTSLMPVVQEISGGSKDMTRQLADIDTSKIKNFDQLHELTRVSKSLAARSNALLFEMIDFVKGGKQ